jgi:hypothetical protein
MIKIKVEMMQEKVNTKKGIKHAIIKGALKKKL